MELSSEPSRKAETIEKPGCSIVLRRAEGPLASELFLLGLPRNEGAEAGPQADAIYRAILDILGAEGGSFASVVSESVFLRDPETNLHCVRSARAAVLAEAGSARCRPARTEIEQPPLDGAACLEVAVHAVLPKDGRLRTESIEAPHVCDCEACARSHAVRVEVGDETHLRAGALCGAGEGAYEQASGMFAQAERLLAAAGMEFSDVVRTWIHLRDIDRDYDDLNRARREFFAERGIDPVPASTGIGGGPVPAGHALCLGFHAVKAARPPERTVMTSPTLNEAGEYGADFVRGMKVAEANKLALHVSGTASVDEAGRTAHVDDFEAQVDRMLVNVAALLEEQGASFEEIVSGITYLKRPEDADRLRQKFRDAGFDGFPNALVAAQVCRPDLLCETEVLAILPRS